MLPEYQITQVAPPEGLQKNGSKTQILDSLRTFANSHQLNWSTKSTFATESQKAGQVIQLTFGKEGSQYLLYLGGLVPEVVYVFKGEKLFGLHLNHLDLDNMIVTRNRYVFSDKGTELTLLVQKLTSTGTKLLHQETKFLNNQ
ncbi:hypothetical protein KKD37_01700 [Patescibacteria group bacterium]|nr:hypothetical protein [Patescibacteria group bacterium]